MPILADYHLHSCFSADSDTPMEAQVQAAMAAGLLAVCFTEHLDLDWPYENTPHEELKGRPFTIDYNAYHTEFLRLKEKYKGRIALHFGLELGLNIHYKEQIRAYLEEHPDFEFIIGSTHSSRHQDPYEPSFFTGISVEEALRQYFTDALENVTQLPWFDSYGHLDYPIRYAVRQYTSAQMENMLQDAARHEQTPVSDSAHDNASTQAGAARADFSDRSGAVLSYSDLVYLQNKEVIDEILRVLIDRSIALEVNTQALKKGFPWTNPGKAVLRRYHELGGRMITIGADAHQPDGVGYGFALAQKELQECGFDAYLTFDRRQAIWHTL